VIKGSSGCKDTNDVAPELPNFNRRTFPDLIKDVRRACLLFTEILITSITISPALLASLQHASNLKRTSRAGFGRTNLLINRPQHLYNCSAITHVSMVPRAHLEDRNRFRRLQVDLREVNLGDEPITRLDDRKPR
jgi:hypothetical protein